MDHLYVGQHSYRREERPSCRIGVTAQKIIEIIVPRDRTAVSLSLRNLTCINTGRGYTRVLYSPCLSVSFVGWLYFRFYQGSVRGPWMVWVEAAWPLPTLIGDHQSACSEYRARQTTHFSCRGNAPMCLPPEPPPAAPFLVPFE